MFLYKKLALYNDLCLIILLLSAIKRAKCYDPDRNRTNDWL